ncbi:MAG: FAD-dependent oxidoreductase [Lachnospiraceae bacterium]|nr:FAD-dependent oxidoreductase [Lachnospiraceae bacterium]
MKEYRLFHNGNEAEELVKDPVAWLKAFCKEKQARGKAHAGRCSEEELRFTVIYPEGREEEIWFQAVLEEPSGSRSEEAKGASVEKPEEAEPEAPKSYRRFSWQEPPAPVSDEDVGERVEADVVVIGAGQAGTCAARAASEVAGARVVVLEQQEKDSQLFLGIGEIGAINSAWALAHGAPWVDVDVFVNDWQLRTGNRSNYRLIRRFAEKSGECFDWMTEVLSEKERESIRLFLVPKNPHMPEILNGIHAWPGTACLGVPLQNRVLKANQEKAAGQGARFFFGMKAERILREENGAVTGVLARGSDGAWLKVAAKSVVLAAGDYSKNPRMCEDLLTEAADLIEPGADFSGHGWDGSGILMGVWAGGRLEPRSHGAMGGNYSFPGFEVIGSAAVLRVNRFGRRYSNEGFGTHILAALPGARQPDGMLYGIFDSHIWVQETYQAPCHGSLDYRDDALMRERRELLQKAETAGEKGYATGKGRILYSARTPEELAGRIYPEESARETFLETFYRYNAMCREGRDAEFGKEASLMHEICHPPFYACGQEKDSRRPGGQSLKLLVTVGGLLIDEDQRVLDERFEPIPGLFATGNCSGCRFGAQYTTSVPGQSISIANTLGREAGYRAAEEALLKKNGCHSASFGV